VKKEFLLKNTFTLLTALLLAPLADQPA